MHEVCERAAAEMRVFDTFAPELRRFLADYPRGAKASQVKKLLAECGGDTRLAIREIRYLLPVRHA